MPVTVIGKNSFTTAKGRQTRHGSQSQSNQADTANCLTTGCNDIIDTESKALQCSGCNGYCHCDCAGEVTEELYKAMNDSPDNPFIFLCHMCIKEQKIKQAPLNEKVTKIGTLIQANNQAIENISKKLANWQNNTSIPTTFPVPCFREIQKLQLEADREVKEIEGRKASCVVYNLTGELDDFIPKLCSELDIKQSDILSATLIPESKRAHKPVKLKVSNEAIKWHIVGKIRAKFKADRIYAKPDLTPKQASEERSLLTKLKTLREKDDGIQYKIKNFAIVTVGQDGRLTRVEC